MGRVAHCPRVGSRVSVRAVLPNQLGFRGSNTATMALDYKKDINKQIQNLLP